MGRTKRNGLALAIAIAMTMTAVAAAAPGDLDPSFGTHGKTYLDGDVALDLAVEAGGGTVVATDDVVTRLTPGGEVDTGFGHDGVIDKPFDSNRGVPDAVAIQPNGRIVVAGHLIATADVPVNDIAVARYLADGSLDTSFSGDGVATLGTTGSGETEIANDVAIQGDGKILLAGSSGANAFVARFGADGTPDAAFSGDGWIASPFGFPGADLLAVAPGPAGSAYAAGVAKKGTGDSDLLAVRLDTAGAPDPAFDTDGIRAIDFGDQDGASELAVQPDGNLVLAGSTKTGAAFARLTPAGALDPAFSGDGRTTTTDPGAAEGLGLAADGGIYAIGGSVAVIRLQPNGNVDPAFGDGGAAHVTVGGAFFTVGEALAVAPDGKLVIAGGGALSKDDSAVQIARLLTTDGPPDADADGVLDSDDDCALQAGEEEHDGCPLVKRKVTLTTKQGLFHGKVSVSAPGTDLVELAYRRCLFQGKVTIYRKKRGPDRKVAATGASSSWTADEKAGNGKYYASMKAQLYKQTELCGGAKSKVLRG